MNLQVGFSSLNLGTVIASEDNQLYLCGRNDNLQLGKWNNGKHSDYLLEPISFPTTSRLKMVASGQFHSLALTDSGEVFVWGRNDVGQLGLPESSDTLPKPLPLPSKTVYVTAGAYYSIFIQEDGSLLGFGQNLVGELGIEDSSNYVTPHVLPALPSKAVQVACGWNHTIVLLEDGTVYGTGRNAEGQLGLGHNKQVRTWRKINFHNPVKISAIACGANYFSLALTTEGQVWSWGYNEEGCLGVGHAIDTPFPLLIEGFPGRVIAIACGDRHSLALAEDNTLYSWGWNAKGQLGCVGENRLVPKVVSLSPAITDSLSSPPPSPSPIISIACGYYHSVVFCMNDEVYTWGGNEYGELIDEKAGRRYFPSLVEKFSWRARRYGTMEKWEKVGKWLFMGGASRESEFSVLPVEVIYHFALVHRAW
jgi:alpha-tubulin suppressor-like RCC1 family protein